MQSFYQTNLLPTLRTGWLWGRWGWRWWWRRVRARVWCRGVGLRGLGRFRGLWRLWGLRGFRGLWGWWIGCWRVWGRVRWGGIGLRGGRGVGSGGGIRSGRVSRCNISSCVGIGVHDNLGFHRWWKQAMAYVNRTVGAHIAPKKVENDSQLHSINKSLSLPPMDQHTERRAQMERRVRAFMMSCS